MVLVSEGKGCSSAEQPSVLNMMGIMAVSETDMWLLVQILVLSMGSKFAVSSMATFMLMIDGHVACPLWV